MKSESLIENKSTQAPLTISKEIKKNILNPAETAALKLQSIFRGYSARKKFRLKHISEEKRDCYEAFFIGNDPVIKGLHLHTPKNTSKPIAVIGTSVIRSVEIALQVRNPHVPKVIIVDNSRQVIQLWSNLRHFSSLCHDSKEFLTKLPKFLSQNSTLYRYFDPDKTDLGSDYPTQDIQRYFEILFKNYGSMVLKVISSTTLIAQNWEDETIFEKIKNVLSYLDIKEIYIYPSNILSFADEQKKPAILENIYKLNPKLAIHTDHCENHGIPENVFLLTENQPDKVREKLTEEEEEEEEEEKENIEDSVSNSHSIVIGKDVFRVTPKVFKEWLEYQMSLTHPSSRASSQT